MLTKIRNRPRPDKMHNETRKANYQVARFIYLGLLFIFTLSVGNYLVGDMLFFEADGLIVRDQTKVASTYIARVGDIAVEPGKEVKKGDMLFRIQSTDMLDRMADLSNQRAQLAVKLSEFNQRAAIVERLMPLAQRRKKIADELMLKFDEMAERGFLRSVTHDVALRANFEASEALVKLELQKESVSSEQATLMKAIDENDKAIDELRARYHQAGVRAPISGTTGPAVPSEGEVFRAGDQILALYSGKPYVLTYLPNRYLFNLETGTRVRISNGRKESTGTIEQILAVTDELPKEFQNTFKPRSRSQLARIIIDDPEAFPLQEKVTIVRTGLQPAVGGVTSSLAALVTGIMTTAQARSNAPK